MKRPPVKVVLPIFVAVALIAVLVVTRGILPAPPSNDHPIKIIIYTDFECIACARFASEIEPVLRKKYVDTGKAQIEVRLLGAISDDSARGAEAALCARDQGKFYEYKDALFDAYAEEEDIAVFSVEALTRLAARLGLDVAAFAHCLTSGAHKAEVEENMWMAQMDGVHTVPAFLVGNITIRGRWSLDTYIQAIEEVLAIQPQ